MGLAKLMASTQLLYRGEIRQRIKFDDFIIDDAYVKLNLMNSSILPLLNFTQLLYSHTQYN